MTAFDEAQHPREHDGKFAEKPLAAPEVTLAAVGDLSSETPTAIDERLAEIWARRALQLGRRAAAQRYIPDYEATLKRLAVRDDYEQAAYYEGRLAAAVAEVQDADIHIDSLAAEARPFEDEFLRRGGWSRAFLVSGGHVHSSMDCSTCFPTTAFHWMPSYSGKSESEIVEAAGERACTVCYPSAPVDTLRRPTKMFTPEEAAAAEARKQREREKAERDATREAKAIAMPDGKPLRDALGLEVKTLVTAERNLVASLADVIAVEKGLMQQGNPSWASKRAEERERLIEAIAHKKGITKDAVVAEAQEKAEQKVKRDWR